MIEYGIGKINLGLTVKGQRADGYHLVETIILPIELFDRLSIEKTDSDFIIEGDHFGSLDYCYLVHQLMEDYCQRKLPVTIERDKNIPVGAGLAGGTADGTALARGLNDLYNLGLSTEDLQSILSPLGADFPYCVLNQPSLCTGIGDIVDPIADIPRYSIVLLNPGFSISAKEAYELVESSSAPLDQSAIIAGLRERELIAIEPLIINDLEPGLIKKHPIIQEMKERLKNLGAEIAIMTGSGPTVLGLFSDHSQSTRAYEALKETYPIVIQTWTGGDR